ncbi:MULTISPECIES: tetratricopeptide repeat-containing diguanylate cyclase [unclassified Lysinibacillus]|uniref:tetratricopeptide repeat-containing diguanylate cyclase n=1 Tax=unclassified Lysinibacillus TaxID=2636778 RepID=UPI00201226D8|nr:MULTISPECIES: tetratricopeptide repeat-containing diguanylate cyclase [unclassified Lysinibacillus]MCL1694525.1 diguanylate cyclase [Lysinibacillus sp. BPa_S21]MCL1699358.1 diguanylate cyclase [Lysinibacillus sp. Bpr_S20]
MNTQEFEELWITLNELYEANRFIEYIELSSAAIESAITLGMHKKAIRLLRFRCASYFQTGDLQVSISVLEQYRELTFQYGDDIDLIHHYILAAVYWGTFGHLKKSKEFLVKGLKIAERVQHIESIGKIYNNLSDLENSFGNYQIAKDFALKSLYYANFFETKHENPYTGIMYSKINLAVAQIWLEEFEEADELLQELLAMIQKPPYSKLQLEVMNAYALLCEKQGRIGEAIDLYQKSKYYALQNNDLSMLQTIYNSLVQLIEKQGNKIVLCAIQKEYIDILLEIQRENYTHLLFEMEYNDQKKQLEKTSYIDPLTNIYNRRYFDENAEKMLEKAAEENQQLALLMIDLDHFKEINDTNGHLFGDDALTITATTLKDYFQSFESIVGRFGGDEFIVLCQLQKGESLQTMTEDLYQSLNSLSLTINDETVQLEFSIGVSTNKQGQIATVEELIQNADTALYTSKRNGRNQITVFDHYSDAEIVT